MSLYTEKKRCRSCDSDRLDVVLDLGVQAISDFPEPGQTEYDRAPLTLIRCHDCTLVQLAHTVDRDRLYRRYYYKSSTNESMVEALRDVVRDAGERVQWDRERPVSGRMWLDIGANDGTLVQAATNRGWTAYGVDPAPQSDLVFKGYFPCTLPGGATGSYRVITSIAQFYNVDDVNAYVAEIKRILHPDGIWVVQMMDVASMLRQRAFDNICHEHLTYWNFEACDDLLDRHGLHIDHCSRNSVNGGSVRFVVKHGSDAPLAHPPEPEDWQAFRHDVLALKNSTLNLLGALWGQKVFGYGASTKFSTMAQFYGIGKDMLPCIADRNPDKWGKTTVTGIPIVSEDEMRWREPQWLFVGPWHFLDAFRAREAEFLANGGQFIVPLPELRIVGGIGATAPSGVAYEQAV